MIPPTASPITLMPLTRAQSSVWSESRSALPADDEFEHCPLRFERVQQQTRLSLSIATPRWPDQVTAEPRRKFVWRVPLEPVEHA